MGGAVEVYGGSDLRLGLRLRVVALFVALTLFGDVHSDWRRVRVRVVVLVLVLVLVWLWVVRMARLLMWVRAMDLLIILYTTSFGCRIVAEIEVGVTVWGRTLRV